jgi:uncharacterized phage protein (TIGR02218 family)
MSYNTSELSEYDARPFFLYKFVRGSEVNTFTSNNNLISYETEDYLPSPISHRGINQTGQVERVNLDIVFPKSDTFARTQFSPDYNKVTFVTIFRGHSDFPDDIQVMWKGRVTAYKVGGSSIVLTCENIQTALRRNGLKDVYQRPCRHALYGSGCGLDINDWYTPFTATAVSETVVTLNTAPSTDNFYTGGILKFGDSLGFILSQVGTTVALLHAMPNLVNGSSIDLAPGCDLRRATCEGKFNNVLNFGGMPYIPSRNPFNGFVGEPIN